MEIAHHEFVISVLTTSIDHTENNVKNVNSFKIDKYFEFMNLLQKEFLEGHKKRRNFGIEIRSTIV
jgi:hypothetical protein